MPRAAQSVPASIFSRSAPDPQSLTDQAGEASRGRGVLQRRFLFRRIRIVWGLEMALLLLDCISREGPVMEV